MLGTLIDVLATSERINTGVKYLDDQFGDDWHDDITLTTLDLHDFAHCVLGQLSGNHYLDVVYGRSERYDSPRYWLEANGIDHNATNDTSAARLGFDAVHPDDNDDEYDLLDDAWSKLIYRKQVGA